MKVFIVINDGVVECVYSSKSKANKRKKELENNLLMGGVLIPRVYVQQKTIK